MSTVVHFYDFTSADEEGSTIIDRSGTLNNGVFNGDAAYKLLAGKGRTLDFPIGGGAGNVQIVDAASLDITTAITVGVYMSKASAVVAPVLIKDDAYKIDFDASNIPSFSVFISGAWQTVTSAIAITTDTDVYIEGTYDGTDLKIRINGAEQGTASQTGAIATNTNDLLLGSDNVTAHFEGYIREVIIKNTANALADHKTDLLRGRENQSQQFIELLEIAIPDTPVYLTTYFESIDITITT